MRPTSTTQKDSTTQVNPKSAWRVQAVKVLPNYQLEVVFVDGLCGRVNLALRVHSENAGVFASLKDVKVFNQVFVHLGVVTWPGEIDLAPDAMYESIKKTGEWVLPA